MLSENHRWNILGSHFKKKGFVHHQIDSFNHFLTEGIENILKGEPPLVIKPKNHDAENTSQYEYYIINISNPHISKPTVIEETRKLKGFTPAEARRRNLNYDAPVYVNIQTKIKYKDQKEETCLHKRVVLCRIPIMLRSCKCYLETMTPEERIRAGECERDGGGYFIVKGNERTLVCQLRGAYNIPIVLKQKSREKYSYVAEIRSMSNETGHSVLLKACMGKDDRTLVLSLPYIKELIPVGVVMKALGVFSAKDIQDLIDLNHPKMKRYIKLFLRDSYFCNELESGFNFFSKNKKEELLKENPNIKQKEVLDHVKYMWETLDEEEKEYWKNQSTQYKALNYIGQFSLHILKENERVDYAKQVITSELFPHLGITSSMKQKKFFLGYILNKLISTHIGLRKQDDRDNYQLKRVESAGILCYELFRQLYKKYRQAIVSSIEKKKQNPDILAIVNRLPIITNGLRHSFATGNWGVPKNSYIRAGVSQILSRLSYGATLSNLRRINIPMGKESKNTKIRQIHPSQIMFICPVETPEGAPVGIVLNLSLLTKISEKFSPILVIENLEPYFNNVNSDEYYNSSTKIFINGGLVGSVPDAERFIEIFMKKRSANFLPYSCSISYNDLDDEISIFCDEGRLLRPVFTVSGKELIAKEEDGVDWDSLVEKGRIVYLDNNEINDKVIAFSQNELTKYHNDYCEIAPAMMMGIMGSMIPFPDHSQSPRNCYQAAMGKQAISMYALSHLVRTDTITHVLTYPQKPLVTTRAAEMMGFNAMPSGINAIVAVACYTGFNQEDSIILNYSAVQRGLFWATSYRTFVGEEKKQGTYTVEKFGLPPLDQRRHDANYSFLDDNGIIRKRHRDGSAVYVQQGDVIVGKVLIKSDKSGNEEITDSSLVLAKGEGGYVDRIFVSTNPNGYKLVKIVLRKTRIPEIGDKFASRSAQKGTCGMVYAQQDMPWTADGICPDIIINPHCLSGDTIITLENGDVEYIKNIYDKPQNIVTVNPETLEETITQFTDGFVKKTEEMFKIKTTSGRTLKCTPEHLWLVKRAGKLQWVQTKDLISYSDKLIVKHTIKPLDSTNGEKLFVEKGVEPYWDRLESLGFVGEISERKAKILARLLGALESDGHLQCRNEKIGSVRCLLHLGEMEDYKEVCIDCEALGFKKPSVRRSKNCYRVELEVALGVLLKSLGACTGNKAKSQRNFPQWILRSSSNVKREFLSGYHGGDGSKVVANVKTEQQQVRIRGTRCRSYNDVLESHINYLENIQTLYRELEIETTIQKYKAKEEGRTDLMLAFSYKMENLEKVADTIAYRYCNHKRRNSLIAIEYLKSRINNFKLEYFDFCKCFLEGSNVFTFVKSIEKTDNEPVYDFTTVSKNHSFIANGIVSHNCLPSRMTINQLMETVLGKAGCMTGEIADATPFTSSSVNVAEEICNKLQMQGFDRTGKEVLYNGKTGQPMGSVFIGPVYYQRLKHMVSDKMHARAQGPNTTLTRQPLEGRSRDGGLRFGEMERDCMIAHGTSRFLQGALCDRSDPYNTPICEVCGNFSTSGKNCKGCQTDKVSQINIPYISKLVIQELNSMLIKCKIKAK